MRLFKFVWILFVYLQNIQIDFNNYINEKDIR